MPFMSTAMPSSRTLKLPAMLLRFTSFMVVSPAICAKTGIAARSLSLSSACPVIIACFELCATAQARSPFRACILRPL
jgi:hypothetical protein